MSEKIHIIAEAGTNHNGSLLKAKNLVDIAKNAKADSVKFQVIYPWGLYLPGDYEYGHYDIKEVIRIREEGMIDDKEYDDLAAYANEQEIDFTASVFDERGIDLMDKFDPPYFKTASCDLNNVRLLRKIAERGRKMIISTGMSSLRDIEYSLNELRKENFDDIVLLHCVSVYPAELQQTNLSFLDDLKEFGFEIGFSDHTGNSNAAVMALVKGATWFEKHFTKDKTQDGFDHAYAMEENGLANYVKDLRDASTALESRDDKISDAERYTRKRARRSLYASRDIEKGETLTDDDILCVRPEGVMDADQIDLLLNKPISKKITVNEPFTLDHIQ